MSPFTGKNTVGTHVYDLCINISSNFSKKMREITIQKSSKSFILFCKLVQNTNTIDHGVKFAISDELSQKSRIKSISNHTIDQCGGRTVKPDNFVPTLFQIQRNGMSCHTITT